MFGFGSKLCVKVGLNCVGVGSANLLHRSLRNTLRKLAVTFIALHSISAGNRRERSKVKKTMIIQEYFRILVNIHSFHNLRPFLPVTRAYRMKHYIAKEGYSELPECISE